MTSGRPVFGPIEDPNWFIIGRFGEGSALHLAADLVFEIEGDLRNGIPSPIEGSLTGPGVFKRKS